MPVTASELDLKVVFLAEPQFPIPNWADLVRLQGEDFTIVFGRKYKHVYEAIRIFFFLGTGVSDLFGNGQHYSLRLRNESMCRSARGFFFKLEAEADCGSLCAILSFEVDLEDNVIEGTPVIKCISTGKKSF